MTSTTTLRRITRFSIGALVAGGLFTGLATPAVAAPAPASAFVTAAAARALPYGPDTCKQGFVWREAALGDHVCVTPATRQRTWNDNARAAARRDPNGPYGPNTCKQGFVWRNAFDGDAVCVTPQVREQTRIDNSLAAQRRVRG